MKLRLQHGLPIVTVNLTRNNQSIVLHNVLFDTGWPLRSIQEPYGFDGIVGIDFGTVNINLKN